MPCRAVSGVTDANVTYPDGSSAPADAMIGEDPITEQMSVLLPSADRAGFYTLAYRDAGGAPRRVKKAADLASSEFDPAMLSIGQLREKESLEAAHVVGPDETMRTALHAAKMQSELSTAGLALLLGLLVLAVGVILAPVL